MRSFFPYLQKGETCRDYNTISIFDRYLLRHRLCQSKVSDEHVCCHLLAGQWRVQRGGPDCSLSFLELSGFPASLRDCREVPCADVETKA